MMHIILASQSPRRRELLGQMGITDFQVITPMVEESWEGFWPPDRLVKELSLRKALAVRGLTDPDSLIIAADTVVVLDHTILGKPKDEEDARLTLLSLSGKRHSVYTGVTVLQGDRTISDFERTWVTFRSLSPEEISGYLATGEPMDKAGSYGIQGRGALLVSGIEGDYFNVMGLPVSRLGQILNEFGIRLLEPPGESKTQGAVS